MERYLKEYAIGSIKLLSLLRQTKQSQLIPILESAIGKTPVIDYEITVDHYIRSHPGESGRKTIPTFHCKCGDGSKEDVVIFAKQTRKKFELGYFDLFRKIGLPVPKLHGCIEGKKGGAILLMEYLPHPARIFKIRRLADAIDLIARVNTATSLLDDLSQVTPGRPHQCSQWHLAARGLWSMAREGRFDQDLQVLCDHQREELLSQFLRMLEAPIKSMQRALNLQGYYDIRRSVRGDLTIVDLAGCCIDFRFQNISGLINELKRRAPTIALYAEFYCSLYYLWRHYVHSGDWIALSTFRREVRLEAYANAADDLYFCFQELEAESEGEDKSKHDQITSRIRKALEILFDAQAREVKM